MPDEGGWNDIDRGEDYLIVAPDFLYRGGDSYDFSKARDVSRPESELKYLVLDAVIRAQAAGQAIGKPINPLEPRIAVLVKGESLCF